MSEGFKVTRKPVSMPAKKSASTELKEDIFYFIIIIGVYYLLTGIWKILTAPFRALLMSDKSKLERAIKIARAKRDARENLLYDLRDSSYDLDKGVHVLAPANQDEGTLDTMLMNIPNVYFRNPVYRDEYYVTEEFLDYFERQLQMHMEMPFSVQHKFLRTIRKYYPEFTPKLSVIPSEIEDFREKAKAVELTKELYEALGNAGIYEDTARDLIVKCEGDPKRFKKEFELVKRSTSC